MKIEKSKKWTIMRYIQLFINNPGFRYLWLSNLISYMGNWLTLVANLQLLNLYLPGSVLPIGMLFICKNIPGFLVSPINGIIADKFDRRKVMIICDIIRIFGALSFLLIRSKVTVYIIYLIVIIQTILDSLFNACNHSVMTNVVRNNQELVDITTISGISWSSCAALGSALGGIIVGFLSTDVDYISIY